MNDRARWDNERSKQVAPARVSPSGARPTEVPVSTIQPNDGPVVYAIQAEHGGPVKIGYCALRSGVQLRLASLQTGSPWPLVVRSVVDVDGIEGERGLHEQLADYRLAGEWFMNCSAVAMATGAPLPKGDDEGRRLQPLVDSAFAAGRAAGERDAEAKCREQMRWWCDATLEWFAEGSDLDLSEGAAEHAARVACKLAGTRYPGRTAHESPTAKVKAA